MELIPLFAGPTDAMRTDGTPGQRVDRTENLWCPPGSVARAVGELNDEFAAVNRATYRRVPSLDIELALKKLRVDDRVRDE